MLVHHTHFYIVNILPSYNQNGLCNLISHIILASLVLSPPDCRGLFHGRDIYICLPHPLVGNEYVNQLRLSNHDQTFHENIFLEYAIIGTKLCRLTKSIIARNIVTSYEISEQKQAQLKKTPQSPKNKAIIKLRFSMIFDKIPNFEIYSQMMSLKAICLICCILAIHIDI